MSKGQSIFLIQILLSCRDGYLDSLDHLSSIYK